jgi:hypothetical protein
MKGAKMRTKLLAICVFALVCGGTAFSEESKWTAGAANDPASGRPQAKSTILGGNEKSVNYEFTFENKNSLEAYLQYPMKADAIYSSVKISAQSPDKDCQMDVWLEGDDGWNFQKKLELKSPNWNDFTIPIVEASPDKVKYVKMVFSQEGNPATAKISVRKPEFTDKLNIDDKSDGLEKSFKWSTLVWNDKDGGKRASIDLEKKNNPDGIGIILGVMYDFPDENCTQVVFKIPLETDCQNKKISASVTGDNSGNKLEIWVSNREGQTFLANSIDLNFNNSKKIGPIEMPKEVNYAKDLRFIIVKNKIGKGKIKLDGIGIEK